MSFAIEQNKCSCCHRCRTECPVGAITMSHAKYFIRKEMCIECGRCVRVCHNGAISNPEKPETAQPHERIQKTCDICVVGGGGAGLVAAAKAADAGLKVIILEKAREAGGCSWYAGGFVMNFSKWHKMLGMPDRRKEQFEEFMNRTENRVDPELLRRMFRANAEFVDWLIDEHELGKDYVLEKDPRAPMGCGLRPKYEWHHASKRIDRMIGPGEIGSYMTEHLLKDIQSKGGEIRFVTEGKKLLTNECGDVSGILASDRGGDIEISCKALILATGCFSHNREIMKVMQPSFYDEREGVEPIHIFAVPTCTGDGLTMGKELGADIDCINQRVVLFGPMRHPYPCASLHTTICGSGARFGSGGNYLGKDPDFDTLISPLAFDPKRYCWHVVDEEIVEAVVEEEIHNPPQSPGMDLGKFMKQWREVFAEEEEDHSIVSADTLDALAEKLGFDTAYFKDSIGKYNRWVEAVTNSADRERYGGRDARLKRPIGEKGPYYAIKMKLFHENSIGGLVIDQNAAVLRNGKPIGGLFAAGDTTRGIMVSGNVSVYYVERVFSALTKAYNEGYIAGEEAVRYIREQESV